MTQEEKAKRFDEIFIKARKYYDEYKTRDNILYVEDMEDMFPEFKEKESEDDIIRKDCLKYLDWEYHCCSHDEDKIKIEKCIAWLKKQGEKKPTEWHREDEQNLNVCLGYIPDEFLRRWLTDIIHVKYDKPAEKVEPKFNVGDWVVSPNGVYWHIDKIINNRYEVTSNTGESSNWNLDTNIYHKFIIQDAKDGDVLCSGQIILLFKRWDNSDWNFVIAYAGIDMIGKLQITNEHWLISNSTHPATKEQRELLFQKMKEAGYEWDSYSKKIINNR